MRERKIAALAISSFFVLATFGFAQGSYQVVQGGAPTAVPAGFQAILQPQGMQFENAQGSPLCVIWWRKGIPTLASSATSPDVLYGGLSMGEFVGVLQFPAAATDYRGQSLKVGYYTLRYALIPQDGNHMGVSSYRDFLLLTPIANDSNPDQVLSFHDVVKGSRLSTTTGHPAVMMLDAPSQDANAKFPSAVQDDQGDWVLDVKLDVKPGGGADQQLPFALVLVGQYQG